MTPTPEPEAKMTIDLDELVKLAVRTAMLDAWNEICADTDYHPLDIKRRGRKLEFQPGHWADHTASIVNRLLNAEFRAQDSTITRLKSDLASALEALKRITKDAPNGPVFTSDACYADEDGAEFYGRDSMHYMLANIAAAELAKHKEKE